MLCDLRYCIHSSRLVLKTDDMIMQFFFFVSEITQYDRIDKPERRLVIPPDVEKL